VFQSLRGVSIREPDPFAPFQDERAVYHDDVNDYATTNRRWTALPRRYSVVLK
jgi:hypothetical protein